jgi:tripartite ATP-independent transporter DctP family solute receptor
MKRYVFAILTVFLIIGCTTLGSIPRAAAAEQKTVSFANGMATSHAINVAFQEFSKKLEERSNGTMKGVLYPNNQLGSDIAAIQAVQDHSLVMSWTASGTIVPLVPEMAVFDIPFLFSDIDMAVTALGNKHFLQPILDRYKKINLMNMGLEVLGFRWMSSKANRRINKLEDLRGFKIRTMENPIQVAFWRALGAAPTPLSNAERYTALQQGTVDGQENTIENAYNTKMYEVQDVFYNTRHIVYVAVWVADPQFFAALTDSERKIYDELWAEYLKRVVDLSFEKEETLLKDIEEKYKKTVVRQMVPGEYERWREAARPVAEAMVRKRLGNEIVELLYEATWGKK